jgi:hypothetical protein
VSAIFRAGLKPDGSEVTQPWYLATIARVGKLPVGIEAFSLRSPSLVGAMLTDS